MSRELAQQLWLQRTVASRPFHAPRRRATRGSPGPWRTTCGRRMAAARWPCGSSAASRSASAGSRRSAPGRTCRRRAEPVSVGGRVAQGRPPSFRARAGRARARQACGRAGGGMPGAVVSRVDVERPPIRLNGGRGVAHLDVLVPHQRPRRKILRTEKVDTRSVSAGWRVPSARPGAARRCGAGGAWRLSRSARWK